MRIGNKQIEALSIMAGRFMYVVPNKMTNRLIEKGLMRSDNDDGSWAHISSDGLRVVANALDSGQIDYPKPKLEQPS